MIKIDKDEFIKVCNEELTMARASARLGLHFNTFARIAKKLEVYKPNPSGKGTIKKHNGNKIELNEILEGLHPHYQTNKLRIRLINEGLKKEECEVCGLTEWNGKTLSFELDHIDGDRTNHKFNNLRIICPNCHSQTQTYRGKNI